jgi:putative transposase
MVSPLARRSAVKYLVKQRGSSQRRACVVVGLSRSMVRYIARRSKDEAMLIKEIHRLATRHSRYGYCRITVLLRREGWKINKKRVHRIWRAGGLSLPLKRPRRRRVDPVGEMVNKAEYPNHVWSYDFVEDRTERGGKLRVLAITEEYTRECLAIRVVTSIPALAVVEVLEWLLLTRGVPKFIRSDNGPELISRAVCQWLKEKSCQSIFITPCSPWENGYIESFFEKLRDECLNREILWNGKEAQTIVESWRLEYNNYCPHSSLDYLTPVEFARRYYEKNQVKEIRQLVEKAGGFSL